MRWVLSLSTPSRTADGSPSWYQILNIMFVFQSKNSPEGKETFLCSSYTKGTSFSWTTRNFSSLNVFFPYFSSKKWYHKRLIHHITFRQMAAGDTHRKWAMIFWEDIIKNRNIFSKVRSFQNKTRIPRT